MRPWNALLALVPLLTLAARPAHAVFAHGLEATSSGAAVVTSPPDESSLHLDNLGSSGQDGVDLHLTRLDGHGVLSSSSWSSTDDGAVLSFSWRQTDGPPAFHTCDLSRTASGLSVSGSLMVSSGALDLRTVLYFLGDDLVHSSVSTSSSPLEFSISPGVPKPIPGVVMELDRRSSLTFGSLVWSEPVSFSAGGSALSCDRVVVVGDLDRDGALDLCTVRCTNPPGGTFSSLDVSSQSVARMGHSLVNQGLLHFSSSSSSMVLNIGSQGSDGVTVTESLSSRMRALGVTGGGGGGGAGGLGSSVSWSSSRASSLHFPVGSLVLRPGTDEGASLRCDVLGSSSCSADNTIANVIMRIRASDAILESRFSSMCADQESVFVSNDGVVVLSAEIALDGSVLVSSPPASPLGMAINEKGLPGEKGTKKSKPKTQAAPEAHFLANPIEGAESSVVVGPDGLQLHVSFADDRMITVGGTLVVGDDVTFQGRNTLGGGAVVTISGTNFAFERSSTGSLAPSSVEVQDISSPGGDQVLAVSPPGGAISSATPVVQVPVVVERDDTSPMRGFSVQVELSPELVLAGPVVEYDYLSRSGGTQMFVVDDGGGRHTVDCVILGPSCGPSDDGTLFTIPVSAAPGVTSGTGVVRVTRVQFADCINDPIPSSLGSSAHVPIDFTAPSSVSLTATQVTTGNGSSGTTRVLLVPSGSLQPDETLLVYRAPFGNYPEYDDGPSGGSVPSLPSFPPPAPWSPVSFTLGSLALEDHPPARDFFYHVAVVRDRFGNASATSALTSGTLSYHLGDVSDGVATCSGDNQVTTADISALGSSYGTTLVLGSLNACLDVGPTSDGRVSGRPLTDNRLGFEDLILFAINYSVVSRPADRPAPAPSAANALTLELPGMPDVGGTFEAVLGMSGAGDVMGLSATLDFDDSVLELVGVAAGELLARQDREAVVLTEGRHVDAALLGEGAGFAGDGVLARVRFRVRAAGDPRLSIAEVRGRDARNQPVWVGAPVPGEPAPVATRLRTAFPDPFDRATNVVFSLRSRGPASVSVFDVAGRHVRTLLDGVQPAGQHTLAWDGRRDDGVRAGAGVYLIRLLAGDVRETRVVRLVP